MAFSKRLSIDNTTLTKEISAVGDNVAIKTVSFCNTEDTHSIKVDLFINNTDEDFYIIKNVDLPAGATIEIDMLKTTFNSSEDSLRVKIQAGSGGTFSADILTTEII